MKQAELVYFDEKFLDCCVCGKKNKAVNVHIWANAGDIGLEFNVPVCVDCWSGEYKKIIT